MADALKPKPKPAGDTPEVKAWLDYWASRPLPILQSTKAGLAGFAGKGESARIGDIADLVLRDPLLTAHALRQINGRERSSLAADVVSIESIVMLMGVDAFIGQFSRLPTVESLLLPKHAAQYHALLQEVATARLAGRLARDLGFQRYDAHLDEVFVTALLARIPRMLQHLAPGMPAPPADAAVPMTVLARRWKLPEVCSNLLDPEHGVEVQRGEIQRAAIRLAEHLQLGWWQAPIGADLQLAGEVLGISTAEVWALVRRALLDFAHRDWPYAQIFPPARWLAMLPGEWPKPQPKAGAAPAKAGFNELLRGLQAAGDSGASFNQIMTHAIRALAEGAGFKRILFGLMVAGQRSLKTRYVFGAPADDPLRAFEIELGTPHLFSKLLLKPQSVWLNVGNRPQFEALLPRGLRQAAGEGDFMAMSLFVNDKPVGLFFADSQGGALSDAQYAGFKQVCLLTGQCLTRQARRLDLGG